MNSKGGFKRIEVSERCPVDIPALVQEAKDAVLSYFNQKLAAKQQRQQLKSENKVKMSAQAFLHKILRDEFGITPTFSYSDTCKSQYMLSTLPFTDPREGTIDIDAGEQFRQQIESRIEQLEQEYGIDVSKYMPLGGNRIRGCWEFRTYGPDIIYNKTTKTYQVCE